MEACHRCFEPLQRRPRTLLERLFLARVLYCSTCARKTRFLHEGVLRFLGRLEWLFNFYTSCAQCGFAYVTRVPSTRSASHAPSLWTAMTDALRAPTYRCDRCETSYGDFRPARYSQPEKPAPRPARVVRVTGVNPEASIDVSTGVARRVAVLSLAAAPSFSALPIVRATDAVDGAMTTVSWETAPVDAALFDTALVQTASFEPAPWKTAPPPSSSAIIDVTPSAAAHTAMDDVAVDDDVSAASVNGANGSSADRTPHQPVSLITIDVLRPALPAARPVQERPARATVNGGPSLDVIRTLPPLDIPDSAALTAAAAEKVARATAECARLEALLAAFERHGRNRARSQPAQPARASHAVLTPAPQASKPKAFTPTLAN